MKKWMFFSMVIALMPLSMMAQDDDDMYFASSKKSKAQAKVSDRQVRTSEIPTYYVGSSRSVDEYNRMGSRYEIIAADTSDIITFDPVEGVYPDSVSDFQLTQQMVQYDDYVPSANYWEGYADGRRDAAWHSPFYHSWLYPWYDPWYDHWYWQTGWYDPWYYTIIRTTTAIILPMVMAMAVVVAATIRTTILARCAAMAMWPALQAITVVAPHPTPAAVVSTMPVSVQPTATAAAASRRPPTAHALYLQTAAALTAMPTALRFVQPTPIRLQIQVALAPAGAAAALVEAAVAWAEAVAEVASEAWAVAVAEAEAVLVADAGDLRFEV